MSLLDSAIHLRKKLNNQLESEPRSNQRFRKEINQLLDAIEPMIKKWSEKEGAYSTKKLN